ncbi:MAG: filamentous hemagglutinin N-terminal domain-containing protein [Epsilonproteobacteria bacterium]|nr:filamentous hemagglutinin N-terminal domain-containing protein [Campylobacterota bacterium]
MKEYPMRNTYLQRCDYTSRFRILKGGKISLVISAFLAGVSLLHAAPSGGVVTSGTANIAHSGSVTTINQSSQKASINWQNFSIGASETVNFNQPNVSAITLNRVIGNEKSIINGALNANGQVWILNSNGVLFNASAKVNTAGLLATTMQLSDEDFQKGVYSFKGDSSASVINLGEITISDGGYASLLAHSVQNEGTIKAIHGTVTLTGAREATINLNGNSLVSLKVDKGVLDALVENKGAILADGGNVYLTTNAVNELLKGVVNNTGIIEANSLDDVTGEIILFAHGGALHVNGTLEAEGGFVETSGKSLHVEDATIIKTKKWLIDPDNITIESSGGGVGGESVSATAIQNALSSADIELQATYDITVNENITWATAKKLTLTAGDEIYVNATIQNTNTTNGGVYFNVANTTHKVIFDANGKVIIHNPYQLQWISQALNGVYELGGNINASGMSSWNGGEGFVPIGTSTNPFDGNFDGKGYTIDGLSINRPSTNYVGLFGVVDTGGTLSNLGLINATITGASDVGGLVGWNYGTLTNVYATGSVSGGNYVGGLVGFNVGTLTNVYATGNVSGESRVGGLVGYNGFGGVLSNAYATGSVSGEAGNWYVGGLVGANDNGGSLSNVYATGSVSGSNGIGGLVGGNLGHLSNAYATGSVSGSSAVGGLVGYNGSSGTISNSYWDTQTTVQTNEVGLDDGGSITNVIGLTTVDFANASNFSGLNTAVWSFGGGTSVEGYEVSLRPYLVSVTTEADKPAQILLFNSGWGTAVSPYAITNWTHLQNINYNTTTLGKYYALSNNLNSATAGYTNSGEGFVPIGTSTNPFVGNFDGNHHTIDSLMIDRPSTDTVGLFGVVDTGGTVSNLGLTNVSITGWANVGGLVGDNYGTLSNAYATGSVDGNEYVGGLVGTNNNGGSLSNVYATGNVTGYSAFYVGGLVGWNIGNLSNAYATGSVHGMNYVGGLVGKNDGVLRNAYATGRVMGYSYVGGLVGENNSGMIGDSYWDTQTTGQTDGIGLDNGGIITILTGLTTTQMQQKATFTGFDFDTIWVIYEGHTYPLLRSLQADPNPLAHHDFTFPNVAHIENGTATHPPFFTVPTDRFSREAGGIFLVLAKINSMSGGIRLPEGLEEDLLAAQP